MELIISVILGLHVDKSVAQAVSFILGNILPPDISPHKLLCIAFKGVVKHISPIQGIKFKFDSFRKPQTVIKEMLKLAGGKFLQARG